MPNLNLSIEMQQYDALEQYLQKITTESKAFQQKMQKTLDDLLPKLAKLSGNIKELEKRPGTERDVKEFKSGLAIGEMRVRNMKQQIQKSEENLLRETEDVRNKQNALLPAMTPRTAVAA